MVSLQVLSLVWRHICTNAHPTCSRGKSDRMEALSSSTIKMASNSCMSAQLNRLPTRKSSPWSFKIYRKERHTLMEVMMICPSERCTLRLAEESLMISRASKNGWSQLSCTYHEMMESLGNESVTIKAYVVKGWHFLESMEGMEKKKTVPAGTGTHGS